MVYSLDDAAAQLRYYAVATLLGLTFIIAGTFGASKIVENIQRSQPVVYECRKGVDGYHLVALRKSLVYPDVQTALDEGSYGSRTLCLEEVTRRKK